MADVTPSRTVFGQFLRFGIVGVFGLFVDMAALAFALNVLELGPYWGRVVSYLTAATFTWACNRTFTFHGKVGGLGELVRQWFKFVLVNAFGGLVNYGVYALTVGKLGPAVAPAEFAWAVPYAGVALGSVSGMFFNFFASRKLVFRQ